MERKAGRSDKEGRSRRWEDGTKVKKGNLQSDAGDARGNAIYAPMAKTAA